MKNYNKKKKTQGKQKERERKRGRKGQQQQGPEICDIISAKCFYFYTRMECCSVSCKQN